MEFYEQKTTIRLYSDPTEFRPHLQNLFVISYNVRSVLQHMPKFPNVSLLLGFPINIFYSMLSSRSSSPTFPSFVDPESFIAVFTTAQHWFWAILIQFTPTHHIILRIIPMLSSI
jgi:hypothetical protein